MIDYNKEEMIDKGNGQKSDQIAFPIRGIDYDPVERVLYTGDEMGYMHKWDLNVLLDKMERAQITFLHQQMMEKHHSSFITEPTPANEKVKFDSANDVQMVKRWKAHKDAINWITFVPELRVIGSCSYDCNVFMWNTECEKMGSLVLGNKATAPGQELDPETSRYRRGWKI